jgi:hypothetical protein
LGLSQACRVAKEKLLGETPPGSWSIHVAGRGSRLIGGGLHSELLRPMSKRRFSMAFSRA